MIDYVIDFVTNGEYPVDQLRLDGPKGRLNPLVGFEYCDIPDKLKGQKTSIDGK
jgi:hypothetical protein